MMRIPMLLKRMSVSDVGVEISELMVASGPAARVLEKEASALFSSKG